MSFMRATVAARASPLATPPAGRPVHVPKAPFGGDQGAGKVADRAAVDVVWREHGLNSDDATRAHDVTVDSPVS